MPGSQPLAPWGVDEVAERLYLTALRHQRRSADELAEVSGTSPEVAAAALRTLTDAGLVTWGEDGRVDVVPPAEALEDLVEREERRLAARHDELAALRSAIGTYAAEHLAGEAEDWTPVPVDVLSAEQAATALANLARTSTGEVLTVGSVVPLVGGARRATEDAERAGVHVLGSGRRMRALYPASVLEDPRSVEQVRRWAGRGEESRLLPAVAHPFEVFGGDAVMTPARWGRTTGQILVVRTPVLVAAMREMFELLWARAIPVPLATRAEADDERRLILALLAAGAKDEAIARNLRLSLRTVRRRVAALMDEVGASTRFQAGIEAVRRGIV